MRNPRLIAVEPVLPTRDLRASVDFYERLGFRKLYGDVSESPGYVGVCRNDVVLCLQRCDPSASEVGERPSVRILVADIESLFQEYGNSRVPRTALLHAGGDMREFTVVDPGGNTLTFFSG